MSARASIVLLYENSFYNFDTLSSLILYSAKNVEILRNKQGVFLPNTAKENFDHVLGNHCTSCNQQNNNIICYFGPAQTFMNISSNVQNFQISVNV